MVLTGRTARARVGSSHDPPSVDGAEVGWWHQALGKGVADAAAERVDHVFFGMAVGRVVDPLAASALASVVLKGERSITSAPTGRLPASTRNTRAFFVAYTVLLLEFPDALFQPGEIRDGHHVGQDGPQRRQPDRLGFGALGERGDLLGCPGNTLRHPADGLIERPAANRLDLGPGLRLVRPALGRPLGYPVGARPLRAGFALRDRGGQLAFEARSFLSGHGAHWHARVTTHRASDWPDSRLSARGPGWPPPWMGKEW